jgi:hypothetical protein
LGLPACSAIVQQFFSWQVGQQAEHERLGAPPQVHPTKPASNPAQQLVEQLLPAGRSTSTLWPAAARLILVLTTPDHQRWPPSSTPSLLPALSSQVTI